MVTLSLIGGHQLIAIQLQILERDPVGHATSGFRYRVQALSCIVKGEQSGRAHNA